MNIELQTNLTIIEPAVMGRQNFNSNPRSWIIDFVCESYKKWSQLILEFVKLFNF